jgi:hypothetical protein
MGSKTAEHILRLTSELGISTDIANEVFDLMHANPILFARDDSYNQFSAYVLSVFPDLDINPYDPQLMGKQFIDIATELLDEREKYILENDEVKTDNITDLFIPSSFGENAIFDIGCDYKGVQSIVEFENDRVYIPDSDYCFIKCYNKFLELIKSDRRINTAGISSDTAKKDSLTKRVINQLIPCTKECLKNLTIVREKCSKDCFANKKTTSQQLMLDVYKVKYNSDTDKIEAKIIGHHRNKTELAYSIALIHVGNNQYHAILIKGLLGKNRNKLTTADITLNFEISKKLVIDVAKVSPPKPKLAKSQIVIYDIETSTIEMSNCKKRLDAVAVGYTILDITNKDLKRKSAKIYPYHEIVIHDAEDNVMDKFFKMLANDTDLIESDVHLFAHNGGRFDSIYANNAKNIKHISAIKKGSHVKNHKITIVNDAGVTKHFSLKDTYPYTLQSLKEACETFKTTNRKLSFDIIGKTLSWYNENYEQPCGCDCHKCCDVCKTVNWRHYLKMDVMSLSEVALSIEKMYRNVFGCSITNYTGLPGMAWDVMGNNCYGMKKLVVPKHHGLATFMHSSIYGGRVLCFRQMYENTLLDPRTNSPDTKGLISIDMNSLYPSAMAMCGFPVGTPILFNLTDLNATDHISKYNNFPHYIVNARIEIPNIRYAIHPYKTKKGNLIYPSNKIVTGVYNDVDLRQMMIDGYKVLSVDRGIYWVRSERLFSNLINDLFNKRNQYKKLPDSNPEQTLEYLIKIMMNSMYGKYNESIRSKTYFTDDPTKHKKGNKSPLSRHVKQLANGQYEVTEMYIKVKRNKPIYIASYILAHSRAIVNDIIRNIGVENVYYSDTDSIYIRKAILDDAKLVTSSALGGFKNDYGEGSKITGARFIGLKRYFLKFENVYDKKGVPIKFKPKFSGIQFSDVVKSHSFLTDEMIALNELPEDKLQNEIESIYDSLLSNPEKKFKIVKEQWSKLVDNVQLHMQEVEFQAACSVGFSFVPNKDFTGYVTVHDHKNLYEPVGFDSTKEEVKLGHSAIDATIKAGSRLKLASYGMYTDPDSKFTHIAFRRPLMVPESGNAQVDKKMSVVPLNKCTTSIVALQKKKSDGSTKVNLVHIEKYNGKTAVRKILPFGYGQPVYVDSIDELSALGKYSLISILDTDENKKKYGCNYITHGDRNAVFKNVEASVPKSVNGKC